MRVPFAFIADHHLTMHTIETVYSAFTTTESILRNDSSIWSQAQTHISFNEASGQFPQPSGFLWPSDFPPLKEARMSAISFASPPSSSSTFEDLT